MLKSVFITRLQAKPPFKVSPFQWVLDRNIRSRSSINKSAMAPPPILALALPSETGRVLSIQSHTVQGYVGNKSAVFPLQLLGFDVDPINSVQFSNHTGKLLISLHSNSLRPETRWEVIWYPTFKGQVLNGDQLWDLIEGLEANNLLYYTHLLTGYIGSVSFLNTVLKVVDKLRSINPGLTYVCDPVLGDEGKLYVPQELVSVYREKVVPVASMLTPNQFEAEQLTGLRVYLVGKIRGGLGQGRDKVKQGNWGCSLLSYVCNLMHNGTWLRSYIWFLFVFLSVNYYLSYSLDGYFVRILSEQDGKEACNILHAAGPSKVVITSININGSLLLIGSHQKEKGQPPVQFRISIPKIPAYFTGTGDLTTALLLGWSNKYPDNLDKAAELAVSSLQALLARTIHDYTRAGHDCQSSSLEIRLIQSQDDIRNPEIKYKAQIYN
ncbi:hypothetical protein BUALT_Bualt04G0088500 [Buddleja alternifolia]|uniref:pyridoxal kinase n=1 Tax=Buddleja alternifolia TaxID=168488 RepID=A0AAV6XVJ9_9LAMI|nr:hypothetical protein BUALT_Bualt04G0088500 [Buddleja alternifolia]